MYDFFGHGFHKLYVIGHLKAKILSGGGVWCHLDVKKFEKLQKSQLHSYWTLSFTNIESFIWVCLLRTIKAHSTLDCCYVFEDVQCSRLWYIQMCWVSQNSWTLPESTCTVTLTVCVVYWFSVFNCFWTITEIAMHCGWILGRRVWKLEWPFSRKW